MQFGAEETGSSSILVLPPSYSYNATNTRVTITISAKPNVSGVTTLKTTSTVGGLSDSQTLTFGPYPPWISNIPDTFVDEDGTNSITFTISDPDTPLTNLLVSVTSSNASLIDGSGLTVSGTTGTRTLKITPRRTSTAPPQ